MKLNVKTFAGVGLGLLAGYFLFKSKDKKVLYIGGMGLAGGLLANFVLNQENEKKQVTLSTKNYIQNAQDELTDEETGDIELQEVPTIMPLNQSTTVRQNFDIDLGLPQ
jgi:hypothetical protein